MSKTVAFLNPTIVCLIKASGCGETDMGTYIGTIRWYKQKTEFSRRVNVRSSHSPVMLLSKTVGFDT